MNSLKRASSFQIAKKIQKRAAMVRTGYGRPLVANYRRALPASVERKVVDTASAQYACDTTGSVTALNLVATGTDINNRIGRKVMLKSVQVRGTVYPVDDATQSGSSRVMVVYDAQPNPSAIATITDILQASEGDSYQNLNNRDRFKVLADYHLPVGRVSNTATQTLTVSPGIHEINCFKSVNLPVIFNGTTTAVIGAITTGVLLLVTIGTQGAGLGGQAQLTCRVRFTDA